MTGKIAHDHGMAGFSDCYHPEVVYDPRFPDWKFQIEKAWELYSSGTKFYGHDVRNRYRGLFVVLE